MEARVGAAPAETTDVLQAAEVAVEETVEVARAGYQDAPERAERAVQPARRRSWRRSRLRAASRSRSATARRVGPFRDLRIGRRHIHHYVPGIILAFISGAIAIVTDNESIEPKLALAFGTGMGLTLDESALLLDLEDVYWTEEGVLSVQITLAVAALLGALGARPAFPRRGEELVLEEGDGE